LDYIQFKKWFDKRYDTLQLPADCKEVQPMTTYVASSLVWRLEWNLQFDDKNYIRLWESYDRQSGMIGMSRRVSLAYHYGPIVRIGTGNLPIHDSEDPVHIRIDNSSQPIHVHLGAPQPHYPQARIEGLELGSLDMFRFLEGIFSHRSSGKSIEDTFGFKVK